MWPTRWARSCASRRCAAARASLGPGAALGVYNTLQALGLFCGGALGGWLSHQGGPIFVFMLCAGATLAWLIIASNMKNLPRRSAVPAVVIN